MSLGKTRLPFGRPANRGSFPDSAQTSRRACPVSSRNSFWSESDLSRPDSDVKSEWN